MNDCVIDMKDIEDEFSYLKLESDPTRFFKDGDEKYRMRPFKHCH